VVWSFGVVFPQVSDSFLCAYAEQYSAEDAIETLFGFPQLSLSGTAQSSSVLCFANPGAPGLPRVSGPCSHPLGSARLCPPCLAMENSPLCGLWM
jgi:hypothetical protein